MSSNSHTSSISNFLGLGLELYLARSGNTIKNLPGSARVPSTPRLLPVDIKSTTGGYFTRLETPPPYLYMYIFSTFFDIYQKSVFKYARNARLPPPHPPFRDGKKHSRLAIYSRSKQPSRSLFSCVKSFASSLIRQLRCVRDRL